MGWLLAASPHPCCTCSASALHGDAGRATCPVLTSIFWPGATAFSWGSSYMEMHAASLRNPLGFEPMIGRSRLWAILGLCCPGAAMHLHVAYCMQPGAHLLVNDHLAVGLTDSIGADALHIEAYAALSPARPSRAET